MESMPPFEGRLLGRLIADKYRLVAVRAAGAFGTVFKAEQMFCGQFVRPVAVKVSRQTGLTTKTAPNLFGDALILARIMALSEGEGKQHLVPIYDMGLLPEHENRGYLVMEYVEGSSLLTHIRTAGRVGVAAGLRFVKEICSALALVHRQGAVHRDLKPDNILVDHHGVVRVVDFGLATFADRRLGFAPGPMGTFTYMAPETLLSRSTPASDVYGIGLMMYELFTGGGPHLTAPWTTGDKRDHTEEHYRIKRRLRFTPPSAAHNEIRFDYRWLDCLILRCLEVDPRRRFTDAGDLLAALVACEAGGELPPEPSIEPGSEDGECDAPPKPMSARFEEVVREVRRLLARNEYDQAIDRLDVHRPAEWAVIDAAGAATLRLLGQAYLGRGDLGAARECLEQLRTAQEENAVLPAEEYALALTDLVKCHRGLGYGEQATACQDELRRLAREHP
jgi:eukaryotic-like serine/threonine-protein kinase